MGSNNDWYENTDKEISSLKDKMSLSDYKLYEVELLSRVAKRVDVFSPQCEECSNFKGQITSIIEGISDWQNSKKEQRVSYVLALRSVIKHLEKQHKLVKEKSSLWIPFLLGGSLFLIAGIVCFGLASIDWIPGAGDFGIQMSYLLYAGLLLVIGIPTTVIGIWMWNKYKNPAI